MTEQTLDKNFNVDQFIEEQQQKDQLRFITCGSVDDGKSTLLGRLLYDSKTVFEDQLSATEVESKKFGTQGENIDLALLVDGLQAEREQGITIDVAYRYFETDKRKFIAADTPGHQQYTRNMATGASTAQLAIILIDARKGVITQTKRHSYICSLLGIKDVILAINKMDLVNYAYETFNKICQDYQDFLKSFGFSNIHYMPISALTGENVFSPQTKMPWYKDMPLMQLLETIEINDDSIQQQFRLPIQWVNRPNSNFRGFCGLICGGQIALGDEVISIQSKQKSKVKQIITASGEQSLAVNNESITLLLEDEIDISRGDMVTKSNQQPEYTKHFAGHIIWMSDEPMIPERNYLIKSSTSEAQVQITDLVHKVDINSLEKIAAKELHLNEIGYCKVSVDKKIPIDNQDENRKTSSFIIIDKLTNTTLAAGIINHTLNRSENIKWHQMKVDKSFRAKQNNQKPLVLWFTGLSGSGKSTIADKLEQELVSLGKHTYLLDGDNIRSGLNKDLGFTEVARVENIRRVSEVAKLMIDAGLVVLVSFISPFRSEREMARELFNESEFIEIFVDTPLDICEQRDPKGLYQLARNGKIENFTGIDSDYEAPEKPEIHLENSVKDVDFQVRKIIKYLQL